MTTTVNGDLDRFRRATKLAELIRGGRIDPVFRADGNRFVFAEGAPEATTLLQVDPEAGTVEPLLDTARLRKALEEEGRRLLPFDGLPFQRFRFAADETAIEFAVNGDAFRLDLETYSLERVPLAAQLDAQRRQPRKVRKGFIAKDPGPDEVISPDGRWALTEKDDDLWLRSTYDDRAEQLTDDGGDGITWRVDHAAWAPHGLAVAATRVDTRHCASLPVVHWLKPTEEVEHFPYTKAGGALPHPTLGIVDILSKAVVEVEVDDDPETTVIPVAWLPDGTELLVATLTRACERLRLVAVDPATSTTRVVAEETQETFVYGIRNRDWFRQNATVFDDGKRVLWLSERSGWRNLYLYSIDGEELGRVTDDEFEIEQVLGVDEDSEVVYYLAHCDRDRPYDVHVCRIGLDGTGFAQMSTDRGIHRAVLTPSKRFVVDTHSAFDRAPRVELLAGDGRVIRTLHEADTSQLEDLGLEPGEEFTVTAADDETTLWGVLYRPPGFDPQTSYPVIEWIYGGPQRVEHQCDFIDSGQGLVARALAQLGFVVYTVDGRGTPGRGKRFQDVVHGRFGAWHVEDHRHAFEQVVERYPFIDRDRVGVVGGSWGGYNTIRSLLLAPDVYKVGVAIAPVGDLFDHAAQAIEPYMGVPQRNRPAYDAASSLDIADHLEGKLLLIHGTSDVNATFSAVMKLSEAFIRADRPFDLLVAPGQDHSFSGHGGQYLLDSIARYVLEHLPR